MAFSLLNQFERKKVKKILLLGIGGKTGRYFSQLLLSHGFTVYGYDDNKQVKELLETSIRQHKNFNWVTADELTTLSAPPKPDFWNQLDAVTLTPGLPLKSALFDYARATDKIIFSEIEYCCEFLKDRILLGVTGTDGKSTVTALLSHLWGEASALPCGNFGVPLSQIVLEKMNHSVLVIELSSYQLELARNLQLQGAVFLNIAADHLNRYKNFSEYFKTKWKIASLVKTGGVFICDSKLIFGMKAVKIIASIIFHCLQLAWRKVTILPIRSKKLQSKNLIWQDQGSNQYTLQFRTVNLTASKDLPLRGRHNLLNILFALEMAIYFIKKQAAGTSSPSIETGIKELIKQLKTFKPLSHRFETIFENSQFWFINDSKATTTQATMTALDNVSGDGYLFLGGQGKGETYQQLAKKIAGKGIQVVLYGSNRQDFSREFLRHSIRIAAEVETLEQAFTAAIADYQNNKNQGKTFFLLAPACTSWDQYPSYAHRGEEFSKLVSKFLESRN